MTENKRFVNKGKDIFQYGEWWCSANGEHCADVITTAINELIEENEQLKSENQKVSEQKHIYKQDWKHLCIDKELLDSENEKLKSRVDDLKELNKIYVDFLVNEGYELADVMGKR